MRRLSLWRVPLLLLLGACACPASAADPLSPPLIILLLPRTSLRDWRSADAPTLHRLMATGALAVMNTRSARLPHDLKRETPESAALTLGAGSRAAGGGEITAFHPTQEPSAVTGTDYGELSTRRTGSRPFPGGAVNVRWPQVTQENAALGYDLLPGNLGTALGAHGIPAEAGGGVMAFPVAGDRDGVVGIAALGARPPHPLPRFLVWDAGTDLAAADAILRTASSEVAARRGRMVVISPFVNDVRYDRGERLTPILVWGAGVPAGLLYSPSTHRAGLITNTDFAPSVTAFFGETNRHSWLPSAPFGRPWAFAPRPGGVVQTARLERDAYRQASGMKALPFVALLLGLLTSVAIFRAARGFSSGLSGWISGVIVLALLVSTTLLAAGLSAGILSATFLAAQKRFHPARLVLLTSLAIVLTLAADMLSGDRLMQTSLLGYSAVEGARYYGIGNEAMGALVGSALVAGAMLWRQSRPHVMATAAALFGLSLLVGLPSAGAKAGGLLVALCAFATLVWTATGRRMSARFAFALIAATLLILALVSLIDLHHQAGSRTHIGAAAARIADGGIGEAWDVVRRKLSVEGRLMYHSAWAVPLWLSVYALLRQAKRRKQDQDSGRCALLTGGTAATLACLCLNDAGVVAAALCGTLVSAGLMAYEDKERPMPDTAPAV